MTHGRHSPYQFLIARSGSTIGIPDDGSIPPLLEVVRLAAFLFAAVVTLKYGLNCDDCSSVALPDHPSEISCPVQSCPVPFPLLRSVSARSAAEMTSPD